MRFAERRRWLRPVLVVLAGLAVLAGATVVWAHRPAAGEAAADQPVAVETAAIVETDLSNTEALTGRLGYGTARPVKGAKDGIVTWLPAPGTTIRRGVQLYRVNDRPVPLFYGKLPLFRTLTAVNTVGRDVHVVAENLKALGYRIGDQPRTGSTVAAPRPAGAGTEQGAGAKAEAKPEAGSVSATERRPEATPTATSRVTVEAGEDVLTWGLISAIRKWQRDLKLPVTGTIQVGDVLVLAGAVRVDSLDVQLGDPAQAPLMSVTPTAKVITVPAEASRAADINKGDKVTVELPDDSAAPAEVTAVGTALRVEDGDEDAPPKLTVTVTVDDSKSIARLDSADVQVSFVGATREGVLAVPVGALVALSEGGYAVQVSGGGLVAVETGMFAKGLVEITGTGLDEGTTVVTTS